MGHFSQTCLISHLPITGGTPIRVCLLSSSPYAHSDRHGEAWSFRSIPFRAEYNDYGSIENVHPEDQILVDLALAQFNRDAVEIPQGDNPYHDPPVTRGMPEEGWWDALWEGRLRVRESYEKDAFKVKVPKGIPTWRRVAKVTNRAVSKGELIPGSVVNRIAYGLVRVTYHGDYTRKGEWYKAIRPILERKYRVTERYEHGLEYHQEALQKCPDKDSAVYGDVWFEVSPKDGPYPPVSPAREMRDQLLVRAIENGSATIRSGRRTCSIAWAFIREDAWQALLPLGGPNYTGRGNTPTVEGEKAELVDNMALASKSAATWEKYRALVKAAENLTGAAREDAFAEALADLDYTAHLGLKRCLEEKCPVLKSTPPYMEGMASQVSDMLDQLGAGTVTREQGDRVVQAVAEYAVVRSIMAVVCIAPRPTHGGPQDGAWEAHVAFHNALTPVVANADPYASERGEESDDEGDPETPEPADTPESDVTDEETTYADVVTETDDVDP